MNRSFWAGAILGGAAVSIGTCALVVWQTNQIIGGSLSELLDTSLRCERYAQRVWQGMEASSEAVARLKKP